MKQLQVRNPAARGCIRDVALDEQVCNVSEEAVRFFAPTSHYYFWDPAGFTKDGSVEFFNRRRQTELKHGRISMLATMGYITPEITGPTEKDQTTSINH